MKKKHPVLKAFLTVISILLILLLIVGGAAFIYLNSLLDKVDRTEITGNEDLPEDVVYEEEPTVLETDSVEQIQQASQEYHAVQSIDMLKNANISNILLIGSDRRSTKENGRSDTMILVTLNYDTGNIHLTSLMRAMYVCIPKSSGETWGMLNAAYSWGGPNLLIKTIENNFRIHIDHYVAIDMSGFEKAVDILGGVEVNLTKAEADLISRVSGLPVSSGLQTLNGFQAQTYCRIRHLDSDFKRTSRQRTVIASLMQKALHSDLNSLMTLANELLPLVNTNMSNSDILRYATKALPMLKNPITQRMLPVENENPGDGGYTGRIFINGREMYKVDFEANIKALHKFMLS